MFESILFSQFTGLKSSAFHLFLGCQPEVSLPPGRSLCLPKLNDAAAETVRTLAPVCFTKGLTVVVSDDVDSAPGSIFEKMVKHLAFVYCKYFFLPLTSATIPDIYGIRNQMEQRDPPLVLHRNMTALRNLPLHLSSPLADTLSRHSTGSSVVIVLPGPSLGHSGSFLRAASRSCIVVCVARTLAFCLDNDVTPDFVVNLDTDWRLARLLDGKKLAHTWLVSLSNGNVEPICHRFRGVFFMESFNTGVFRKKYRMRESWLSVSVCCLGLAEALKAPHVIMAGADGCWRATGTHADSYFSAEMSDAPPDPQRECSPTGYRRAVTLPCSGAPGNAGGVQFSVSTGGGGQARTSFLYYAISGELDDIACQLMLRGTRFWQWGTQGILNPVYFKPLVGNTPEPLKAWPPLDRALLESRLDAAHSSPLPIDIAALEACLRDVGQMVDTCLATLLMQVQHNEDITDHPVVRSMFLLGEQQRFPRLPSSEAVRCAALGTCMEWLRLHRKAVSFLRLYQCRKQGRSIRMLYREKDATPFIDALTSVWPGLKVLPVRLLVYALDALPDADAQARELYSGILCDDVPVLLSPAALREAGDVPALVGHESWIAVDEAVRVGGCGKPLYYFNECARMNDDCYEYA